MINKDEIEEKIVSMKFDNKDFEKDVKTSISTLDKLKAGLGALAGAGAGITGVALAVKKISFDPVNEQVQMGIGKVMALTAALTGVVNITDELYSVVTRTIRSFSFDQIAAGFSKYEEKVSGVQVIMNAVREMGESEEETLSRIEPYMEKLSWFADETSYDFTEMVANIGRFTAAGMDLEDTVTAIMGIATWGAKAGSSTQAAATAMYQLSQALGRGAIHLEDWKSIMTLHMDTEEFKKQAIETAAAMGELNKVGNEYYTKSGDKVGIDNFTEHLNKDWFTTKAFMEVAKNYGSAIDIVLARTEETGETASEALRHLREEGLLSVEDLGTQAFQAAMEAKTLTEAIEATRVAVASKFERIYEAIFGNFVEARDLWTSMSETLWNIFAGPIDSIAGLFEEWKEFGGRAKLFKSLARIWEQFAKTTEKVQEAWDNIFGSLEDKRYILENINKHISDFSFIVQNLFAKIRSNETIWENLEEVFLTFEYLIGNTKATLIAIKDRIIVPFINKYLPKIIDEVSDFIGALANQINKLQEAYDEYEAFNLAIDYAIQAYTIVKDKILEVGEAFKEAFLGDEVASSADVVELIAEKLTEIAKNKNPGQVFQDTFGKLGTFLSDVFKDIYPMLVSVWDFLKAAFRWIIDTLKNIGPIIMGSFNFIKEQLDKFTQYITAFLDTKQQSGKSALEMIADWIAGGLVYLMDKLSAVDLDRLNKWLEAIDHITSIIMEIAAIYILISEDWPTISEVFMPFANIFQGLNDFLYYEGQSRRAAGRASILKSFGLLILEISAALYVLSSIPADDIERSVDMLITLMGAIVTAMIFLWEYLGKSTFIGKFGGIQKFADGVKLFFTNFSQIMWNGFSVGVKIKAFSAVISAIGLCILELVAAVWILSTIDTDKMITSVVAIIALGTALVMMLKVFMGIINVVDRTKIIALTILAPALMMMAGAMLIISAAVKLLSTIDDGPLLSAVIAATAIMGILIVLTAASNMPIKKGNLAVMALAMVLFATSIDIISHAVKRMAKVKDIEMIKAITYIIASFMGFMIIIISLASAVSKNAGAILAIGIAMDLMALAIVAIGEVVKNLAEVKNQDNVMRSVTQVGLIVAGLAGFISYLLILSRTFENMGKIDFGKMTVLFALVAAMNLLVPCIVEIAAALLILSTSAVDTDILAASASISVILLAIGAILAMGSTMSPASIGNLLAFAAAIAVLSGSLLLLAPALKIIGEIPTDKIAAIATAVSALVAILVFAFKALETMGGTTTLLQIAGVLGLVALGTALLAASALMCAYAVKLMLDEIQEMLAIPKEQWQDFGENISDGIFKTIVSSLMQFAPQMTKAFGTIMTNMIASFINNYNKLEEASIKLITMFLNALNENIPLFFEFLTNFFEKLDKFWPTLLAFLEDVITDTTVFLIKLLRQEVPNLNAQIEEATWDLFLRILRILNKGVPLLNAELAMEGMNLIWWIDRLLSYFEDTVLAHTVTLLDKLINKAPLIVSKLVELSILILVGVVQGLIDSLEPLAEDFAELLLAVLDLVNTVLDANWDDVLDTAELILDGIVEGANKYIEKESQYGGKIWSIAWNFIKGMIIAFSIWNTENNKFSGAYWGWKLVDPIIKGFTKKAEIKSPSKLMERLGKFIPEGLINGISGGFGKIGGIATDMASIVIDNFKKHFGSVSDLMKMMGNGLFDSFNTEIGAGGSLDFGSMIKSFTNLNPTITPELDLSKIEEGIPSIQDMFNKHSVDGLGIYGVEGYGEYANPPTGADSVSGYEQMNEMMKKFNDYAKIQQYNNQFVDKGIEIAIDGNLKKFIKVTAKENDKIIKATNVNRLANG